MSSEIEHAERLAEIDQKRDRRYDRWRRLGNLKYSRKAGVVD
jgi:hypothetical protein